MHVWGKVGDLIHNTYDFQSMQLSMLGLQWKEARGCPSSEMGVENMWNREFVHCSPLLD